MRVALVHRGCARQELFDTAAADVVAARQAGDFDAVTDLARAWGLTIRVRPRARTRRPQAEIEDRALPAARCRPPSAGPSPPSPSRTHRAHDEVPPRYARHSPRARALGVYPRRTVPTDAVPLSSTRPKKGSGLFVLWWGEHDAEEHMVAQEYQTLHRPHMLSLRQPQRWGDARLETGQHH